MMRTPERKQTDITLEAARANIQDARDIIMKAYGQYMGIYRHISETRGVRVFDESDPTVDAFESYRQQLVKLDKEMETLEEKFDATFPKGTLGAAIKSKVFGSQFVSIYQEHALLYTQFSYTYKKLCLFIAANPSISAPEPESKESKAPKAEAPKTASPAKAESKPAPLTSALGLHRLTPALVAPSAHPSILNPDAVADNAQLFGGPPAPAKAENKSVPPRTSGIGMHRPAPVLDAPSAHPSVLHPDAVTANTLLF